jgi:hypothetical protein
VQRFVRVCVFTLFFSDFVVVEVVSSLPVESSCLVSSVVLLLRVVVLVVGVVLVAGGCGSAATSTRPTLPRLDHPFV